MSKSNRSKAEVRKALKRLTAGPKSECISAVHTIPERAGSFTGWPDWASEKTQAIFMAQGIEGLYKHQSSAATSVFKGHHTVISTGTASGKSLCYMLPMVEAFHRDSSARFLWLYPTKALAQDQLSAVDRLGVQGMVAGTYDGDTPKETRPWLREHAHVLLSNLDMVHATILPNHRLFRGFLLRLKYIVIDEAHVLRGVFGSHAALVLRRLRRILSLYGVEPVFIFSSATLPDPDEFIQELLGEGVEAYEKDHSPRGLKHFILWNPPLTEERKRGSSLAEASSLLADLTDAGLSTIAFSRTRRSAELVADYARSYLTTRSRSDVADRISPYRAGYLPKERREIEASLREGRLLGVSATNALELGIDIGTLDAAVMNGFPGTIVSTWQQSGRAGRRSGESIAILVAGEDALDQYYMENPDAFFSAGQEKAIVNPENPYIMDDHLLCAAFESPLREDDDRVFGPSYRSRVDALISRGLLSHRRRRFYAAPSMGFAAAQVNLRGAGGQGYAIVEADTGTLIGTVDEGRAFYYVHPGAVYLHRGESYVVDDLDLDRKVALVSKMSAPYYTMVREDTDIQILAEESSRDIGDPESPLVRHCFGQVRVTIEFLGYQRKHTETREVLSYEKLDLPRSELTTEAEWFELDPEFLEPLMSEKELPGALHAFEHSAIALMPLFALCDRRDIGGVSTPMHLQTGVPSVFIYDGYAGGIGIVRRAFSTVTPHLRAVRKLLTNCPCQTGCPSCVQSPKCGNLNEPLDKAGARKLTEALISVWSNE